MRFTVCLLPIVSKELMYKLLPLFVFLGGLTSGAQAADDQLQTCDQIRGQIQAVTGLVPMPDLDLLKQISLRQECVFSSAEAYRAAYGDKPLPPQGAPAHHENRDRDDD